jgi:hypothetical protein
MCGIFGFAAKQGKQFSYTDATRLLTELFVLSETRGKESAGIAIRDLHDNSINVFKEDTPATTLIRKPYFNDFLTKSLKKSFSDDIVSHPLAVIAHSRLVTNGSQENNHNNQPCIKDGIVMVHNGIVTNVDALFEKYKNEIARNFEVDTEVLAALISLKYKQNGDIAKTIREVYSEMEGAASIAALFSDYRAFLLATNTGSLYYWISEAEDLLVFGSEEYIMKILLQKMGWKGEVKWLSPNNALHINLFDFNTRRFDWNDSSTSMPLHPTDAVGCIEDFSKVKRATDPSTLPGAERWGRIEKSLEFNEARIRGLKRCTKCLIPETFPYVHFDHEGVCNYCRNYKHKHLMVSKKEDLLLQLEKYRSKDGSPDCIIAYSGGRDSSWGLHYIVEELKMHPITFTYDWGMVTDLARRNIARMTGQLGVENILVSADIKMKRRNIKLNVEAWLKQPRLGMIPLFMAGDKYFFKYVNTIRQQTGIPCDIWMENKLENTDFKVGFAGIKPNFKKERIDKQSSLAKLQMPLYYMRNFLTNPSYINASIPDTYGAFKSYYVEPREVYLLLFDFIPWNEEEINKTLIEGYNWETSPDTTSTWRIGDGTAAFYNYIYYTVAGFSEFDTFRSNQIREGMITREWALEKVYEENRPRFQSLMEYFSLINVDAERAIKVVNNIRKLYE